MAVDDLDARIDALYGGPPAEFTSARNRLMRELRAAGRVEEADSVRALRRPGKLAAEINRLVRQDPERAELLVAAQDALAAAQGSIVAGRGDAAALRDAEAAEAAALDAFPGDVALHTALRAAARWEAGRQDLLRGRLSHDPTPDAGAGGLFALGPAAAARAAPSAEAAPADELADARRARASRSQPEDEGASRAREEQVRAAIAALEEARRGETSAAEARDAARRDADAAQAAAAGLTAERDALRARLDEASAAAQESAAVAAQAVTELAAAEAALTAAKRERDGAERAARRLTE